MYILYDTGVECMVYVEEIHGGTRGTEYIYFIKDGELVHVSQLPGVKRIKVEQWGRGRRLIVWNVPDTWVSGSEGLSISFSSKGRYPYIYYVKLPQNVSNIKISISELYNRGFIIKNIKDPIRDVVQKRKLSFRLFGPERQQLIQYRSIVPRLVEDLWKELRDMNINDIFISEHSERLGETLKDPVFAEYMSLILPLFQGRIRSLHEKTTRTFEVWLLTKVIRALYDLGAKTQSNILWISFTTNEPAMKMKYYDKTIYVLYQPSIVPHIISGYVSLPKPFHAVPDVAVMILDKEEYISWGELKKYSDNIPLIVEAKLSLTGATRYETIDTTINQVKAYRELLDNKPVVIVPIYHENRLAVYRLGMLQGVKAIDNINPDNPQRVKEFIEHVKEAIKKTL